MNDIERFLVKLLEDLRDNYGVVEVKAELESEGARLTELMRLKEIIEKARLGLVLKIGGAGAVTDMFTAQYVGVTGLIAPMVESSYALRKYLESIEKHFSIDLRKKIHFGINIETDLGYKNFAEMLNLSNIRVIDTITLGRVDMIGSLNLKREDINSEKIYKIAESIFTKVKKSGMMATMGGGIEVEAIPFVKRLVSKKLLDRIETRKIVFQTPFNFGKLPEGILKAHKFEVLWLKNKRKYYSKIYHEDKQRIKMLRKRIGKS